MRIAWLGVALMCALGLLGFALSRVDLAALSRFLSRPSAGPRMEWYASETAPVDRPVFLVWGNFILPDGRTRYIPDRRIANRGWGNPGSTHILNDQFAPLPVAVEAVWYAYTEGIAYHGRAELPVARMQELLRQGVRDPVTRSVERPDTLVLGMAPGGDMAVWAIGINARVLVGMYRAEPIPPDAPELDDELTRPDAEDLHRAEMTGAMTPQALEALARTGPQPGLWRALDTRYRWTTVIEGGQVLSNRLRMLNGELELIGAEMPDLARAAPAEMLIQWQADGQRRWAEIRFDRDETHAIFSGFATDSPLTLTLVPGAAAAGPAIVLTDGIRRVTFDAATAWGLGSP